MGCAIALGFLCCIVAVAHGIGDAFVERCKIALAFRDLTAVRTAPDPAFVVPLHEIPAHRQPPYDRVTTRARREADVLRYGIR